MDPAFVDAIADPTDPRLQELAEQARTGVRESLVEWGMDPDPELVRNLSFTYYHDWTRDDPDAMLLVQDPGEVSDRHQQEAEAIRDLGVDPAPLERVSLNRRFATSWLVQRNSEFTEKFVSICTDHGLISPSEPWDEYVRSGAFFDDFYLADVVKYRTDDHGTRHRTAAYEEYLAEELRRIDPDVLFPCGGVAWSLLRSEFDLSPRDDLPGDPSKITDAHGYLFDATAPVDSAVIPAVHFSGQVYHTLLRDSYFEYLDEGLAAATT